jgi:hypothetical protein
MAKMHSYSVDNQPFRLTVLSWIALATFVTVVLADSLKESSFDFSSLKTSLLSAGSSAGLVTIHWCQLKPKALLNKDRRMDYAMLTHHQSTINQAL